METYYNSFKLAYVYIIQKPYKYTLDMKCNNNILM